MDSGEARFKQKNRSGYPNEEYGELIYRFEYHDVGGYKTKNHQVVPVGMLIFFSVIIFLVLFTSDMNYGDKIEFAGIFIPVFVLLAFIIYWMESRLYFNNLLVFERGIIPPRAMKPSRDLFRRRAFIPFSDIHDLKIHWADETSIWEIIFKARGRTYHLHVSSWNVGSITPVLQEGIRKKVLKKPAMPGSG
jgi:hypothetical protein